MAAFMEYVDGNPLKVVALLAWELPAARSRASRSKVCK